MIIALLIEELDEASKVIIGLALVGFIAFIVYYSFKLLEMLYVVKKKKPLYIHFYPIQRKLKPEQEQILLQDFPFYKRLDTKERRYFQHRVTSFINDKDFIGRDGLEITDEIEVLVSATAVMLTFGFRDFYIGLLDRIFVYPDQFYSNINEQYHQGEFNPKLQTMVISWKHFKEGFDISNDNLNLGIHEFAHAIHLNSIKERDVSSTIFEDSFKELTDLLSGKKELREELIESRYFRDYAYTNQFEFIAVIIESFIETPQEFRSQFPEIYDKTKQMLNFNFSGY